MWMEAETGVMGPHAKDTGSLQKLEEEKNIHLCHLPTRRVADEFIPSELKSVLGQVFLRGITTLKQEFQSTNFPLQNILVLEMQFTAW